MLKADNNENYNYNHNYQQVLDKKYMGWKQYIIPRLEV